MPDWLSRIGGVEELMGMLIVWSGISFPPLGVTVAGIVLLRTGVITEVGGASTEATVEGTVCVDVVLGDCVGGALQSVGRVSP
jgi:hypothetical protein